MSGYYSDANLDLKFTGRKCSKNHICILDNSFEYNTKELFIRGISKGLSNRFTNQEKSLTGKSILNIFRDNEYVEIMYANRTLVYQSLSGKTLTPVDDNGLYLVILERQKGYPVDFLSFYKQDEYDNLVDKLSDSNE